MLLRRTDAYLGHHREDRHGEHHGHHLCETVSLQVRSTISQQERRESAIHTSPTARTTTAAEAAAITTETTAASTSAATTTTAASSRSERSHLNGMKRN